MALEASDLNDGTILQQTKQITDPKGNIQFNITLPSGRLLKSEFMRKDDAREALKKWLEVVKEQAVADSNAERLERAAKSRRGSMDIERRPGDDQPLFRAGGARTKEMEEEQKATKVADAVNRAAWESLDEIKPGPIVPLGTTSIPIKDTGEVDPLEFAKLQHDIQAKRVAELKDAERKLWQWTVIIETLEERGNA